MNALPRRTLVTLAAALILLLLGLNLWIAPQLARKRSATSFGVERYGYKAAFDLLRESGVPVRRSYVRPDAAPARGSLWFVMPSFLEPGERDSGAAAAAQELLGWVRAGGTAVVFGAPDSEWKRLDIARAAAAGGPRACGAGAAASAGGGAESIEGDFAPRARRLEVAGLMRFARGGDPAHVDDRARVRLRCDGAPFALEYARGAGRLVAIADGRFLRNSNLGAADASVLLADLVRALGPPVFDEHYHGLVESDSLAATLAASPVILPIAAGALLALLWVGERRVWPPRRLAAQAAASPASIAGFLDSLGMLYERAGDPAAAFRAYRAGFLRRIRRRLWPHGEFSEALLLERLACDGSLRAETRRWLLDGALPASENELVHAVRALEAYGRPG